MLIADSEHGWAMLQAIAGVFASDPDPPFIFINDALRAPPTTDVVIDLPTEFRETIQGVSPVVPPCSTDRFELRRLRDERPRLPQPDRPGIGPGRHRRPGRDRRRHDRRLLWRHRVQLVRAVRLRIVEQDRNINYQGPNSFHFSDRHDPSPAAALARSSFDSTGLDVPSVGALVTERGEEDE